MRKIKYFLMLIYFSLNLNGALAHFPRELSIFAFNSPISYQQGFGLDKTPYRSAFDLNINYGVLNIAYNYNDQFKSSFFFGLGLGSLLQLQFGYDFAKKNDLFRIRGDLPIYSLLYPKKSIFGILNAGVYYENAIDDSQRSKSFGLTIGVSLGAVLHSYVVELW